MNSAVKVGGTLLVISAVASFLLAGTNQITAPVIEERNIQANNELRQSVLPDATDFKQLDASEFEGNGLVVEAYEGLNLILKCWIHFQSYSKWIRWSYRSYNRYINRWNYNRC